MNIEIPCNVGDYVYFFDRGYKKITTKKVKEINIYISQKTTSIQIIFEIAGMCFSREFGTNVFLNKNEARQALEAYLNREAT